MWLKNFFKGKDANSPAREDLVRATEHFNKGEWQETLRALAWGFKKDVNYKPLYQLAADCLGKLDASDEQQMFASVCRDQDEPRAYSDLGAFYFNVGHYDLAQVFYEKTLQLVAHYPEVAHDLAICYARRFQVGKAVDVLTGPGKKDFWSVYFLNKCKILDRNIDGVEDTIDQLQAVLDRHPDQDDIALPKMKVKELKETLQRYNSVKDPQTHIRDWQFIQYGGVVLDYFDDEDDYVAGGRYVASWGSFETIKALANKLKQFADGLSIAFRSVASLPDRDSEIIGRVLAKEFGIEYGQYDPLTPNEHCLIVSSDSALFQDHEELSTIGDGQVVFSANHSWLDSAMLSPDIIGFMTQTYSFPWNGGGMKWTNEGSGDMERIPPDERSPEDIAMDIFNIRPDAEDISKHLEFYREHKDHLKGIGSSAGDTRYNFMVESPVPGAFFA